MKLEHRRSAHYALQTSIFCHWAVSRLSRMWVKDRLVTGERSYEVSGPRYNDKDQKFRMFYDNRRQIIETRGLNDLASRAEFKTGALMIGWASIYGSYLCKNRFTSFFFYQIF